MIALRYRLGWSLKRIANQFGLKTGAVDGKIRRAIIKIKEQARTEEFERTTRPQTTGWKPMPQKTDREKLATATY